MMTITSPRQALPPCSTASGKREKFSPGPTVLQLGHAVLQGVQFLLHLLPLLVAAVTERHSLLLQR
jgi:DNA-binding IclR family transcriptional regulator